MNGYIRLNAPRRERKKVEDIHTHLQANASQLYTGKITGELVAKTNVHVGTGDLIPVSELKPAPSNTEITELAAAFMREDGEFSIPGSSLKGAFRHLYEAVTYSCLAQTHFRNRPSDDLRACSYRADTRKGESRIEMCPACRVFGGQGYMGQVFFSSAVAKNAQSEIVEVPQRWEPKIQSQNESKRKIYTHQPSDQSGREPIEVLPYETRFDFKMRFQNLDEVELGILLMVLGQSDKEKIYPKLGGLKAHGFGAVELVATLYLEKGNAYLDYDGGAQVQTDMQTFIQKAVQDKSKTFYPDGWRTVFSALKAGKS